MTDNVTLNAGTGGSVVRTVGKTVNAGTGAQTSIAIIDVGGGADASPETAWTGAVQLQDGNGVPIPSDLYSDPQMGGVSAYLQVDPSTAATDGAAYNSVQVPQVNVTAGKGTDGNVHSLLTDGAGHPLVVEQTISTANSPDFPLFHAITGDPSGDFAGVDFMQALLDPGSGYAANVKVVNPPLLDPNNAAVLSDAPAPIPLVGIAGRVITIDTTGYQTIGITTRAMVANVTCSNDGLTWTALSGINVAIAAAYVTSVSANATYLFPCLARYVQLTVTTAGTATAYLRSQPWPAGYSTPIPYNLSQIAGSAVAVASAQLGTNFVNINGAVHSSTNPLYASLVAMAATNNQTIAANAVITATAVAVVQIKASAGRLTMLQVSNGSANVGYLHLINNSAATTSTASVMNIAIPPTAGANVSIILPDGGLYFSSGIAYTVSGAIASGDTTALTSPSIAVNAAYI